MRPGELIVEQGYIDINNGRKTQKVLVKNTGDRPIQVGSHMHFFEVNQFLEFDREKAYGYRLNIPAGTAIRFEPGETKEVELVEIGGFRNVYGFNQLVMGNLEREKNTAISRAVSLGFIKRDRR
ncbi:urease subunit beta [Hydrogenobacter sp. T-2]|uniref:urease subunit beta n=1 Tax=Pampinifervens diazotrophicum TaxID=1632018 RepID=UPI002B25BF04|nr:urease subunit beta [Hydrogenobacter sp. T-2]WPM31265.1 urease subunit beta [Hydrogenobacter sp. T-2]